MSNGASDWNSLCTWDETAQKASLAFHGPIMVQQLFPSALLTLQGAIRVAYFPLVTG